MSEVTITRHDEGASGEYHAHVPGSAHIGRALELLADIGRPPTASNAYALLTSEN